MKKNILFITIVLFNTLLCSGIVYGEANYSKYRENNSRLARIKEGCKNSTKRNYNKCKALQQDLVEDIGVMSCGRLITTFGINSGGVNLCQAAIDNFKPGGSNNSPSDSGTPSDGSGGSGSPSDSESSPSPSDTTTRPGGSPAEEPKPSQWSGGEVGSDLKTTKPTKIDVGEEAGEVKISKKTEKSIVAGILDAVYSIAAVVAVIIIVVCGIMITTSDGDAQKVATARRGIIYAAIGLLIIGSAFIITGVIQWIAN